MLTLNYVATKKHFNLHSSENLWMNDMAVEMAFGDILQM